MGVITYQSLLTLVKKTTTTLPAADAEAIINQAINLLNTYGADLPNMSGSVGSKMVSLQSSEEGAVLTVACDIYFSYYKDVDGNLSVEDYSVSTQNIMGNPQIIEKVKDLASRLRDTGWSRAII